MIIKTRVFDLTSPKYPSLSELARAMGISVSQIYRVKEGKRGINHKFIIGAIKAFPEQRLDDLFYLEPRPGDDGRARCHAEAHCAGEAAGVR